MARLSLQIEASGVNLALGATALVEQLADAAGAPPEAPLLRSVSFGIGAGGGAALDVPPGRYQVSTTLPSGEVLRQQSTVAEDGVGIVLRAAAPPDDRLGLQRLAGSVASLQTHEARLAQTQLRRLGYFRGIVDSIMGPRTRSAVRAFQSANGLAATGELSAETMAAMAAAAPAGNVPVSRGGEQRGAGRHAASDDITFGIPSDPAGEDPWKRWRAFAQADSSAKLFPNKLYDHTASFEERFRDALTIVWRAKVPDYQLVRRRWGIVRTPQEATIVSLPLPWITHDNGTAVQADATVDLQPSAGRSRVTTAILDPELGGLLLYLASGRPSAAVPMLERLGDGNSFLQRIMESKTQNPLAACAAAYIAVATWSEDEAPPWEPWLGNLSQWFKLIPDGAIIEASWMLQNLGRIEPAKALAALKTGFTRGIPFFTCGLRSLQDGLAMFARGDGDARRMLDLVQALGRRADPLQAFTTLRLPLRARP